MPTQRFYRLPEAKRQSIREAAVAEFARVPFENVSINQIIRNAEISRGSFYTYFEDKQDLLDFILEDSGNKMKEFFVKELERNGGDYFALVESSFDFIIGRLNDSHRMLEVARNIFSYQENAKLLGLEELSIPFLRDDSPMVGDIGGIVPPLQWLIDRIDTRKMRFERTEEFIPLMTMGAVALLWVIKQYYEAPERLDAARDFLHRSMELLKHGAYKE